MYTGIVYKYTSPSGKVYIGQTRSSLEYRAGKGGIKYRSNGKGLFWKAIKKYGFDNLIPEVIHAARFEDEKDLVHSLNEKERYYIKKFRSNDTNFGYNLTDGGDGYVMSDFAKKRISESMTGRKLSDSHRKSISEELRRRWREGVFTDERNKKVSESNKHKKTKAHANNISIGRKKSMARNPGKFSYLSSPDFKGHRFKPGHKGTRGSLGMRWYNDSERNYLCLPTDKKDHYKLGMIKK